MIDEHLCECPLRHRDVRCEVPVETQYSTEEGETLPVCADCLMDLEEEGQYGGYLLTTNSRLTSPTEDRQEEPDFSVDSDLWKGFMFLDER
jgi:hypothetical protein